MGKLSSLINIKNLRKFKKRLDPRLYNGAILFHKGIKYYVEDFSLNDNISKELLISLEEEEFLYKLN